jgi:hypothetical protein
VKLAQHRYDGLGRHQLGHAGKADDVDEQHRHGLAPYRPQGLVAIGQHIDQVRREVAREIGAGPLRDGALAIDLAYPADIVERLLDRDFEIVEIDRLGDEIECAAVHRGTDIRHVAIGRDDDCARRRLASPQLSEQCQPIHDRHVDVEQQQLDVGLIRQLRERLLAMIGKAEIEFTGADLVAKPLADQHLKIRFVIDGENLGCVHYGHVPEGSCRNCSLSRSKSTGLVMNWAAPYSSALRRRSSSP